MILYNPAGILCVSLLVVAVSGTPYHLESSHLSSNRFYEDAAAIQVDSKSCAVSGALEVCHSAELESDYSVHVCPNDGMSCMHTVKPCIDQ